MLPRGAQFGLIYLTFEVFLVGHQLDDDLLSMICNILRFDNNTTSRTVDAISNNVAIDKLRSRGMENVR